MDLSDVYRIKILPDLGIREAVFVSDVWAAWFFFGGLKNLVGSFHAGVLVEEEGQPFVGWPEQTWLLEAG